MSRPRRRVSPIQLRRSRALSSRSALKTTTSGVFVESIFSSLGRVTLGVAFAMPILLFIGGCWRRDEIRLDVAETDIKGGMMGLLHAFLWLIPVGFVGFAVYVFVGIEGSSVKTEFTLLSAMGAIGLIVFVVSHDVATFLIDIGLLLEEFLTRISRLTVPAFAFISFYAILVIAFAAVYGIISRFSTYQPFPHRGRIQKPHFFRVAVFLGDDGR